MSLIFQRERSNIINCNRCNAPLISEEVESQECFRPKDIWIIDGRYWIGDGKRYYPYTLPTKSQQRNKTTEDSTEPKVLFP